MCKMNLSHTLAAGLFLLVGTIPVSAQGVVVRDMDYVSGAKYEEGKDLLHEAVPLSVEGGGSEGLLD